MNGFVECHSGYEYGEKPLALYWLGQRLEITQILARWRIPNGKCFLVRTNDEQIFELFYDEHHDQWNIYQP